MLHYSSFKQLLFLLFWSLSSIEFLLLLFRFLLAPFELLYWALTITTNRINGHSLGS